MFYSFGNRDVCINFNSVLYFKKLPERLIFNFDYTVITNKAEYLDYIYIDNYESSELNFLTTGWFKKSFLQITGNIWVRIDKIASIKYKDGKIIYNMSTAQGHKFIRAVKSENETEANSIVATCVYLYENADRNRYNEVIKIANNFYSSRSVNSQKSQDHFKIPRSF